MNTSYHTINSTIFYENDCNNPNIIKKELSLSIIVDTIRESITSQYLHTFGVKPKESKLNMLADGFVLFNLHKNKYMLKNKDELLKYMDNTTIPIEEKLYFSDIFLYNQRPNFLTFDELEYIRACGNLFGYNKNY